MGLTKIMVIALNTFRESVRARIWYSLLIFVLLLVAASLVLSRLAVGSESRIIIDLGLSAMTIVGVLMAIYLGLGLVSREIERRTIDVVLVRPVRRSQFVAGRYLGLLITLAAGCLAMTAAVDLALIYSHGGFESRQLGIWPAAYLIYLELTIMTAVALFFSSFSSPAIAALLSLGIFLIGRWGADLNNLTGSAGAPAFRYFGRIVYHLLPNLSYFNRIGEVARGEAIPAGDIASFTLYAFFYVIAAMAATIVIIERRDFE